MLFHNKSMFIDIASVYFSLFVSILCHNVPHASSAVWGITPLPSNLNLSTLLVAGSTLEANPSTVRPMPDLTVLGSSQLYCSCPGLAGHLPLLSCPCSQLPVSLDGCLVLFVRSSHCCLSSELLLLSGLASFPLFPLSSQDSGCFVLTGSVIIVDLLCPTLALANTLDPEACTDRPCPPDSPLSRPRRPSRLESSNASPVPSNSTCSRPCGRCPSSPSFWVFPSFSLALTDSRSNVPLGRPSLH